MKKLLFASIFVIAFCLTAFGQNSFCPTITLTGPEEILRPNQNITFTLKVDGTTESLKLEYLWFVDEGKIIEGQGTRSLTIEALPPDFTPTVTVEIKGLPQGCQNTFSGTVPVCGCVQPRLFAELKTSAQRIDKALFNGLITELENDSTATAYIIIYTDEKILPKKLKQKEEEIRKYLSDRNVPANMFVIVKANEGIDLIRLFILPQGAEPPTP